MPTHHSFYDAIGQITPQEPSKEDEPYFAAIGRFIANYAIAESQVHLLARKLTRLNDAKGRIVFSGMRLGDLAERIRGLLKVTNAGEKKTNEIDICLRQLDIIATQRNNLVHRFVNFRDSKIVVTNLITSKSATTFELDAFSIADFDNMDSDCIAITLRLAALTPAGRMKMGPYVTKWVYAPWRYKPPQPSPKPKSHPSDPQSRKRRPRASGK